MNHEETTGYASERPDRLLTIGETADVLRISRPTVYRLLRSGDLHAVRVGQRHRFRREDIDAYLDRGAAP
jgi:excisionase family DNA binding protein